MFFRRVQANKLETPYQYFKSMNPDMCEESVWSANKTDDVITFPIVDPNQDGIFKQDLDAISHLELVKSIQNNWVVPGTTESNTRPVTHNVSVTVIVDEEDWDKLVPYLFKNRHSFAAVSFLARTGDKDYAQAPFEAATTDEDIRRFQKMVDNFVPVDYRYMVEVDDGTSHSLEASCAGGRCAV
jgi:ribonucleoside-diphosphate reductase alpha chain